MNYTNRNRIGTLENVLKIRTDFQGKVNGEKRFKVFRLKNNSYIYDGIFSKEDLIEEANNI